MPNNFWYPTKEEILIIHDDIIEEDPDGEPGIIDEDRIDFAIDYIKHGAFGESPETIHEKAFHLMRLLASNHWFVDGNKRTALNTTELFYRLNGFNFDYGEDIRAMLKLFSVREGLIDEEEGVQYFEDITDPIDLDDLDSSERAILLLNALDEILEPLPDPETWTGPIKQDSDIDWEVLSGQTTPGDRTNISDDDEEEDKNGNG